MPRTVAIAAATLTDGNMSLSTLARHCLESSSYLVQDIMFGRDSIQDVIKDKRIRSQDGEFVKNYEKYRKCPKKFYEYTRMTVGTFDYILAKILPELEKKVNTPRVLCANEKLFLTLRYLSSGLSLKCLGDSYCLGRSTVSKTVYQTLKAIWKKCVYRHMPPKLTSERLTRISNDYFSKWQFPNCIGAINGKYFRIKKSPRSKKDLKFGKYFSLGLGAVSDADYKFIAIEICEKGEQGDGDTLDDLLPKYQFNMPKPSVLPGSNITVPHVLTGGASYRLKPFLMRPYSFRSSEETKRVFNERITRARMTVDCAFGILCNKWKILLKPIETDDKHAKLIMKVACLLHNVIRERDGSSDPDFQQHSYQVVPLKCQKSRRNNRSSSQALHVRNSFKDYFVNY